MKATVRALALGLVLTVAAVSGSAAQEAPARSADALYQGLRSQALATTAEELGLTPAPGAPYGAMMEFPLGGATVTLVAYETGDASLYFSTGGGVIGGIGHERIREAAREFVAEAGRHRSAFAPASEPPSPPTGRQMQFVVLTPEGPAVASASESAIVVGSPPLSDVARAGQAVVNELWLLAEQGRQAPGSP